MQQLKNSLVTLRAVEPSDLDFLFVLENEDGRSEASFTTAPASRRQLWQYIEEYSADIFSARQLRLMIVDNESGQAVGAIDISDFDPHDRRGFVGIAIVEKHRRHGFAGAALALLMDYAASTLGMHQLAAVVSTDNVASRRLFAGAGFKSCGNLRSWVRRGKHYVDALVFQRLFE